MSANDFEIERKLGEGAYSIVYKVRRISDGQDYAMKSIKMGDLSPKERENAVNEVRFLASINCPEIIGYKEAFYDEKTNVLNIIMEYCAGGDLLNKIKSLKKKNQYLDEKVVWLYILQMTRGLKKLHDLNVLHRDFKCANLMLSRDHKNLKLGDLNVSKVAKKGMLYTQTGTPYYASPEVWRDKPYNSKSDVWSLGCVVYELTTLNPPFKAQDMEGLFKKVQKGAYDPLPAWYSQDLADFLSLCLQVNPKTRLTTSELLENPLLQKRINIAQELNVKEQIEPDSQRQELLKTLKIGKNLKQLNSILPEPQYEYSSITLQQDPINNSNSASGNNLSKLSQHESRNLGSVHLSNSDQSSPLNEIPLNRKQSSQQSAQQQIIVQIGMERKLSQPTSQRYNNANKIGGGSPYLIQPRKISQAYIQLPQSANRVNSLNHIQSDMSIDSSELKLNSNLKGNQQQQQQLHICKPNRSRSIENVVSKNGNSNNNIMSSLNNLQSIVNHSVNTSQNSINMSQGQSAKRVAQKQESVPLLPPINKNIKISGDNALSDNYGAPGSKKRVYQKNYDLVPSNYKQNNSINNGSPPSRSRNLASSSSNNGNSSNSTNLNSQQGANRQQRGSDVLLFAGKKAL